MDTFSVMGRKLDMKNTVACALPITLALQFIIAAPVLAYENLDEFASARATNINADLQANDYMSDLDDIEAWYVDQQAAWMGMPLPGTNTWTQGSLPTHVPVNWSGLGTNVTSQLEPDVQYGINVYPLTIKENFSTHQVEYWVGTSLVHTMSFRSGYDWTMYTPPGGDTNVYNPARIIIAGILAKDNEMYTYLYNEGFEVGAALAAAGEQNEALEDTDGDGYPNRDEIRYGTDPYDAGERPSITSIMRTGSSVRVEWAAPTNRWYQIESAEESDGLLDCDFTAEGSQQMGNGIMLAHTDTPSGSPKIWRYEVVEADVNGNSIPDWWEYKYWGTLTTNTLTGDNDSDGLDNSEELYFGYSPLVSERDLIHSIYHTVVVGSDTPTQDSGEERFDFHGGGRPLALADGSAEEAWGGSQATLYGRVNSDSNYLTFHSGGAFFNNDEDNLYIGIYGMERETDNGWVVFIDSNTNGVTNLWHLSGPPKAIGIATNIRFDATEFTPNAALILGANDADGKNFPAYSIASNDLGQGVYDLVNGQDLEGFNSTTGGCFISQWSQGASEDSPNGGVEVAISLSALDCAPGDTIKVAAILVGGNDESARWVSPLVYGESVSFSGGGMDPVTIIGSSVQLADAGQTLPNVSYPGFSGDDVLLQGFYWDVEPAEGWWANFSTWNLVDVIANAGFTMIWLPPAYKGSNAKGSSGYDTLDHYDVGQYSQAGGTFDRNIKTRYGSRAELELLISSLQSNGVVVLEDIILNHMVGGQDGGFTYTNYPMHIDAPQFYKTVADFHASTNGHDDNMFPYHNDFDFSYTNYHSYSVDIDHLVPNMRMGLKVWGGWLSGTLGFEGWRLDLTEGVEPWYVWEWLHCVGMRSGFAFMEYWELSNGREMQEWLDLTGRKAAIYDSNLRELLKHMCEEGDSFDMKDLVAPSLLGLEPEYTIVYIDNHDTMREDDASKKGILEDKPLAYAYALHSEGLPMVFWWDYFDGAYIKPDLKLDWGTQIQNEINRLITIRQVAVDGALTVLHADEDVYVQERAGSNDKHKSMLVINDSSTTKTNTIQTSWLSTVLVDLVTTNSTLNTVTNDASGYVEIVMPPESYRVYSTTNALNEVNAP